MLLCDFESRADQRSCGYAAETHDDFRIDQRKLALKPLRACFALIRCRIAILRRPAFYDIADIDILPLQADQFQHHIQKLPCRADKRDALLVFLFPGAFSDKHKIGVLISCAEDEVFPCGTQNAAGAVAAVLFQLFKRIHDTILPVIHPRKRRVQAAARGGCFRDIQLHSPAGIRAYCPAVFLSSRVLRDHAR